MNGQASDSAARIYRHCSVLDLATSALSGFFGIGSGFLIVARADLATGIPILNAVTSSTRLGHRIRPPPRAMPSPA